MIQSTSSNLGPQRPDALGTPARRSDLPQTAAFNTEDTLSSSNSIALRGALAAHPEVRDEVVARGRAMAIDPAYPPLAIIEKLTEMILASQDLTETA